MSEKFTPTIDYAKENDEKMLELNSYVKEKYGKDFSIRVPKFGSTRTDGSSIQVYYGEEVMDGSVILNSSEIKKEIYNIIKGYKRSEFQGLFMDLEDLETVASLEEYYGKNFFEGGENNKKYFDYLHNNYEIFLENKDGDYDDLQKGLVFFQAEVKSYIEEYTIGGENIGFKLKEGFNIIPKELNGEKVFLIEREYIKSGPIEKYKNAIPKEGIPINFTKNN